ncbi:MAG: hypothetical protein Q8O67_31680 [Deltaproteobacteria bacterium]|nr:hypothetical protein [Deltaproteobacteria bacterium]
MSAFVAHLRDDHGFELDPAANWELAFEACFYRDLWHHRERKGRLYSPKRTFDLALFSDDVVVIIEAKAAEELDLRQVASFVADRDQVMKETGVARVLLVGLCSSRYKVPATLRASFDGPILTWAALAARYNDDPILARADFVFKQGLGAGHNVSGSRSGLQLLAAFDAGEQFYVGRKFGLDGVLEDRAADAWREQLYPTNREASTPPTANWFSLGDFASAIRGNGSAS